MTPFNKIKVLFLLLLVICIPAAGIAQIDSVNVTFTVDLNYFDPMPNVDEGNPYGQAILWGSWNNYTAGTYMSTDTGGYFTADVELPVDSSFTYKYSIPQWWGWWNEWAFDGSPPAECDSNPDPDYSDYGITVGSVNTVLDTVCWQSCVSCDSTLYEVTFNLDLANYGAMPNIDDGNPFGLAIVFGSWDGWATGSYMETTGDGIFSVTVDLPPGEYEYKYTLPQWQDWWNEWAFIGGPEVGSACDWDTTDTDNNYGIFLNGSTELDTVCWETCEPCMDLGYSVSLNGFNVADSVSIGTGAYFTEIEEDFTAANYAVTSLVTAGQSEGAAAMQVQYGVHDYGVWGGGYVAMEHVFDDYMDFSDYNYISFWYYNYQAASADSVMVLRLELMDASNQPDPTHWTKDSTEFWYSFIEEPRPEDAEPGWVEVRIPLRDAGGSDPLPYEQGFVRTGFAGIEGNDSLDLSSIVGYAIEFNMFWGDQPETPTLAVDGTMWFDDLRLVYDATPEIPGCMDPLALNYNPDATVSDSSCLYPEDYVDVEFNVNTEQITVHAEGMYMAGGTIGEEGHLMTDTDGDGIWTYTMNVLKNTDVVWKFRNSPGDGNWGGDWESGDMLAAGGCSHGEFNDRIISIGEVDTMMISCYNQCSTDGSCATFDSVEVTFQVNMLDQVTDPAGVYMAGGTIGEAGVLMNDSDGDDVWTYTMTVASEMPVVWKYRNGPGDGNWGGQWEEGDDLEAGGCAYGNYNDRFIETTVDTVLAPVCFSSCTDCSPAHAVDVEFSVDMSEDILFNPSSDIAYVFGSFNDWNYGTPVNLTDSNSDGIWTGNVSLMTRDTVDYLFGYGNEFEDITAGDCGVWDPVLSVSVRRLVMPTDTTTSLVLNTARYSDCASVAVDENANIPTEFGLLTYPNPFNPDLTINYQLPAQELVKVSIVNILGQEVISLVDRQHESGVFNVIWNGRNGYGRPVNSGIYFVVVKRESGISAHKVTLLK